MSTEALTDPEGAMLGARGVALTAEQAEAVARREGSLVLSANAGSGKTTVLVERFVRSVVEDELEAGRILAITFTDRAAGGLRSRIRERFAELGRRDAVRALESAWISTFHGLCARVLRANAVRAGLDPGFRVLDEAEARAVRSDALERALAAFLAEDRPEALDVVAAYTVDRLAELITARHDELRSRGMTRPSLPSAAPAAALGPARAALERALAAALLELPADDTRATVRKARSALESCARMLAGAEIREGDLKAATFRPGNTALLRSDACCGYLAAHVRFAAACRDARAVAVVVLLDELLGRYAEAYAEAKRSRAAVDFDDLELLCRDLLRDAPQVRAALGERFDRIMVDEFQDTNAVQLELLELIGGDRFVVGDELQSIYAFRHADVRIFRAERDRLAAAGASAELATNFRSRPAILGVVDDAFGAGHGAAHVPFVAGRDADGQGPAPLVELLLTDADAAVEFPPETFATLPPAPAWRQAEARLVAQRVADLVEREGVSAGDVVVLLRSAGDVAVFERALEEQGLPTLAAGGRGYWGRQQVLDLCAYLGALANPRDEHALLGLLASPLVGLSSDGLAVLAMAARGGERWAALARAFCAGDDEDRAGGAGPGWVDDLAGHDRDVLATFAPWFAGERARAPRLGLDELLERVVGRTGYDLHVLNLPGGRRRWANVLKLQRLAAGFEARRGRDVRGLIDLATAELDAEAREADAPIELGDSPAVRLMTIHAAKGLEFPVVVVADLGRLGPRDAADLLVRGDRVALRLRFVDGGKEPTLGWAALREEVLAADAEEERRILHVAMTRAQERLILSGAMALDPDTFGREPRQGDPPIAWLARGLAPDLLVRLAQDGPSFATDPAGAGERVGVTVSGPATGTLRPESLAPAKVATVAAEAPGRGLPEPIPEPAGQLALDLAPAGPPPPAPRAAPLAEPPPAPMPAALSYSSLSDYGRCAYRWYLKRVLRLPDDDPGPALARAGVAPEAVEGLDPLVRGSLAHLLLEELDFAAVRVPDADAVRAVADRRGVEVDDAQVADLQGLVAAFARSPLAARLAGAPDVRREHGFVLALGGDADPLLTGFVDVLAFEAGGGALVVDYKSDVVAPGADLEALVEADYGAQRRIYALAALGGGATHVEVAHLFLARPAEPAVVRYETADAPRLRAELAVLSEGIALRRFSPTETPHRALCLTCPGRRALCHHPEERTLAEPVP